MKRTLWIGLGLLLLASVAVAQDEPEATATPATDIVMPADVDDVPEGWTLVWNDEFTDPAINRRHWGFATGGSGFGNNERQHYTDRPDNAYIEDGSLVIEAREERYRGNDYTSAKLQTLVLADWLYGRIDIRARLPYGQGIWPAFWMLPAQGTYGSWPNSGEIDIMEQLGHEPETVYGTIHYAGESGHQQSGTHFTLTEGTFADDFHTFTLIWEAESLRWYVDGVLYQELTEWSTPIGDYPAPFNHAFYLILNLAVGGNWPGYPDATTEFPQRMWIDYVRVYQVADGQ